MDPETIARWRLADQRVSRPAATPTAALAHLAAAQGQDFLPATWALAQRARSGAAFAEITAAFDRGDILRTHMLRPTWHLCRPDDLRWLLKATAPRVHQVNAYQYRALGVDQPTTDRVRAVLERVLPGTALTRGELARHFGIAGIESPEGPRLAYLLMYAELEALVVSGPLQGRQHTYMLVAERAPDDDRTRDQALAELARRYFTSRGPATARDFATWASLTLREARDAIHAAAEALQGIDHGGRTYWTGHGQGPPEPAPPRLDLVQGLDELVMSYSESRDVLGAAQEEPPPAYFQVILRDGRLAGHWRYERRGRTFAVQSRFQEGPTVADRDGMRAFVAAFARFTGAEVSEQP